MTSHSADVLVVGLGNPILSDDGIGWRVVSALRDVLAATESARQSIGIDIREVAVGGLSLAEMLIDFRHAVIVDAIMTKGGNPGTVYHFKLEELPGTLNMASAHDTNLRTALHALRRFGANVPPDKSIEIVAIEAHDVWTFSERFSPEVEAAIPEAVDTVRELIQRA